MWYSLNGCTCIEKQKRFLSFLIHIRLLDFLPIVSVLGKVTVCMCRFEESPMCAIHGEKCKPLGLCSVHALRANLAQYEEVVSLPERTVA